MLSTTNLNLRKIDTANEGNNTFNVDTYLNGNWDILDSHIHDGRYYTETEIDNKLSAIVSVGKIDYFAQKTAPTGYLKANGAAVSRSVYANLFAELVTNAGFTPQAVTVPIVAGGAFTVTISLNGAIFTRTAHGFVEGQRVRLSTTGALPTGLNTNTNYYVLYLTSSTFKLSLRKGGAPIGTSGTQSGTHTVTPLAVFTKTAHGFTGGELIRLSTNGALPTGLDTITDYRVLYIDADTFNLDKVCNSDGIVISGTQSGTHSYLQSLYGLGDGATTFNLPDLRGHFARAWDDGAGVDAGRTLGSKQDDEFKIHNHGAFYNGTSAPSTVSGTGSLGTVATDMVGGSETRPKNIALLACIRY